MERKPSNQRKNKVRNIGGQWQLRNGLRQNGAEEKLRRTVRTWKDLGYCDRRSEG